MPSTPQPTGSSAHKPTLPSLYPPSLSVKKFLWFAGGSAVILTLSHSMQLLTRAGQLRQKRPVLIAALSLATAVVVACGSSGELPGQGTESPANTASQSSPSAATIGPSNPSPDSTPITGLTPEELLDLLFTYDTRERRIIVSAEAVDRALETGDRRFLPPLVELTRWVLLSPERNAVQVALNRMTEQDYEGFDFFNWYSWLGRNYDGEEFENYPAWKARLYNHIDPRFAQWFFNDVESEIPLWTAQWGGVRSDGIPPLDNPKMIPATDAIFMEPDEQVFGVSINGDTRAYPLRFMNWHEMANDVVGGKPVTLAY